MIRIDEGLLVIPDPVKDEHIPRANLSVEDFIKKRLPPNILRPSGSESRNIVL